MSLLKGMGAAKPGDERADLRLRISLVWFYLGSLIYDFGDFFWC
jgi:hypothetical protein